MNANGSAPTDSASVLCGPVCYRPGDHVALVVPGISLLLSVRADESLVTQCWEAIRDAAAENGAGAQERAERLLALLKGANSQRGTVGFALIAVEDRLTRAAGSGDIAVRAEPAAEAAESLKWQAGSGPQDWRLPLPLRAFQIGDPADPAATGPTAGTYPLVAGVVMASSIAAGELRHDESGSALATEAQHPELGETRRPASRDQNTVTATGPSTVAAVKCLAGHLNPPQAKRCRVCPQPVPAQRETHVPRPVLGVLRLSTGEDIPLDRDVLLGRQPKLSNPSADKQHVLRWPSRRAARC